MNHAMLSATLSALFVTSALCACDKQPALHDAAKSVDSREPALEGGVGRNARPPGISEKSSASEPAPASTMKLSFPLERSADKPLTPGERAD